LAVLLGVRGPAQISRLESGERIPPFPVTIAIELLFNLPAASVFTDIRSEVEESFMARAYALHQKLLGETTAKGARKRELLETCLYRGASHLKRQRV